MSEIAEERKARKRKPRVPASFVGERLVIGELLRRGFDAQLANFSPRKHGLARSGRRLAAEAHSSQGRAFDAMVRPPSKFCRERGQSSVYVLLGVERSVKSARFFVVKNSDLVAQFRRPSNWKAFGFIDATTVEKYENNWDILR
jgi:hypothetical protein